MKLTPVKVPSAMMAPDKSKPAASFPLEGVREGGREGGREGYVSGRKGGREKDVLTKGGRV